MFVSQAGKILKAFWLWHMRDMQTRPLMIQQLVLAITSIVRILVKSVATMMMTMTMRIGIKTRKSLMTMMLAMMMLATIMVFVMMRMRIMIIMRMRMKDDEVLG